MTDLNKLAQELHEAAVAKGFWDVEDAEEKHMAKLHSELSEAVQEDRCGRPLLYVDDIEVMERVTDIHAFDGRKPEGIAAELADFVMMLLDWYAYRHPNRVLNFDSHMIAGVNYASLPLYSLVNELHASIDDFPVFRMGCNLMVCKVYEWLEARGVDLFDVIRLKMEYNKNRPKLHGRLY